MFETMMVSSGPVMYVMAAVGILGALAKIVNRATLYRLIKAAGNMPKSTHKLMKLVKAKYEHACMAHESVENVGVFVEKYIYEYRGFLFRIHTWRQIELLSVWFVGILAVTGAAISYMEGGLTETVYQYIAGGAAEAVLLMVLIRMSDEPYKIKAIKMYMVDYLENVCAVRVRRQNRKEKEFIDVIPSENANGGGKPKEQKIFAGADDKKEGASAGTVPVQKNRADKKGNAKGAGAMQETEYEQWRAQAVREILDETGSSMVEKRLPINIEGEPLNIEGEPLNIEGEPLNIKGEPLNIKGEPQERKRTVKTGQNVGRGGEEHEPDGGHPQIREETIRQILEEFLA